jgi:SAM-dependent methyltransferase
VLHPALSFRCNLATPLPSAWVARWLPVANKGARLLDWACGSGRHSVFASELGYQVLALDLQNSPLQADYPAIDWQQRDLECAEMPLAADQQFDVIVVTNYLFRSRLNFLLQHLAPGGLLLYETFALGNEAFGRPRNPDFLLSPGELFSLCERHHFHVLGYEDGIVDRANDGLARVQRIAARKLPAIDMANSGAKYLLLK